ncbi:MAG: tRNA threonylcarbamoyladenosine dehydratase [Candidatus Wallbacteria bacterium HGW-Wallbacteria-1]|uniref:tRNA threonylcarbamoyladenosine dehydratase n=1 Tax=Candidatus Wallbacteria bacterium HGW-Wallbacteria-1 TaxID=2013854 RepID=A0A2N1PJK0_9BACT|nr:MAG: tRNA threonylcarbamoyladenosine dehydratase [Candidatus Wallbacteria bacterium HGW-Wallbacteria-1]
MEARTARLLGAEGIERLRSARVMVIGAGAVGGYALEALTRSGIGSITIVDFDTFKESNKNRQILALDSTMGRRKVDVARERILDINPQCRVRPLEKFAHTDSFEELFGPAAWPDGNPDYVIDAIDSITPKVELIAELSRRGLRTISCMGAALRTDPAQIRIGPLEKVINCPLAATVRKHLRRRPGGLEALKTICVYSTEPIVDLPPQAVDRDMTDPSETADRGRPRRALGSLPTLTGIFGLWIANRVILDLVSDLQKQPPLSGGYLVL